MKDYRTDSTDNLSRFARDKRQRISSSERVEQSPRPRREADSEGAREFRPRTANTAKRSSYNPHFTADNRLRPEYERPRREEGSSDFERPRRNDSRGEGRPQRSNDFGGRPQRSEGRSQRSEGRPQRTEGGRRFERNERNDFGNRRTEQGESNGFRSRGEGGNFRSKSEGNGFRKNDNGGFRKSEGQRGENNRGGYNKFDGDARKGGRTAGGEKRSAYKPAGKREYNKNREEAPRNYPKYNPNKQTGEIRLNRFISQSGVCSRREADDFILAGVVTVNGQVVTELGTKILPTDEVRFHDEKLQGEKNVYLVLNKPKGYVTSLEDPHAEKTVMELVKNACTERVYPVGRLDKNSLGLLLITNDGDITRQLTHPSYHKKKIYQVTLDKPLTRADMDTLTEGITLEDGDIFADEIAYASEDKKTVGIEIHSGRNRIVRRMFEHLGYIVQKLDRVYYAGLTKKNLKRGEWRFLTRDEVMRLKTGQYE